MEQPPEQTQSSEVLSWGHWLGHNPGVLFGFRKTPLGWELSVEWTEAWEGTSLGLNVHSETALKFLSNLKLEMQHGGEM